jgi:hypothetical protein
MCRSDGGESRRDEERQCAAGEHKAEEMPYTPSTNLPMTHAATEHKGHPISRQYHPLTFATRCIIRGKVACASQKWRHARLRRLKLAARALRLDRGANSELKSRRAALELPAVPTQNLKSVEGHDVFDSSDDVRVSKGTSQAISLKDGMELSGWCLNRPGGGYCLMKIRPATRVFRDRCRTVKSSVKRFL